MAYIAVAHSAVRCAHRNLHVFIAESFELVDDHRRAQRWFSMGLRLADDRDVQLSEFDYELLLMGRRRVRQSAGLPEDVLDANAKEVLEHRHLGV